MAPPPAAIDPFPPALSPAPPTESVPPIDPEQDEKTLIFCATDEHADMVVMLLKEALAQKYGSVDDDAVAKITGNKDRPLEAIRRYRNERHPSIAVTVDHECLDVVPPAAQPPHGRQRAGRTRLV
jgi:hypothetical protein